MSGATSLGGDGDGPQQRLIGISFADTFRASEFLVATQRLAANGHLNLLDAVVVAKDAEGGTRVQETIDPTPGQSAISGSMWAGLFGLILGGPVGWLAGAAIGAASGAVTAKIVDLGISDEWVGWFREAVAPGTATVAILATDVDESALVAEAERFQGGRLVYANLDRSTIDRITEALDQSVYVDPHAAAGEAAPVAGDDLGRPTGA